MSAPFGGYVTVTVPGVLAAAGATTSAAISIPVCSSGEVPRFIRVSSTVSACIRLGGASVVATTGDMMVQPGDAQLLHVPSNITKFAVIAVGAAGSVQVSPLENC